jgi:hypothetical protein
VDGGETTALSRQAALGGGAWFGGRAAAPARRGCCTARTLRGREPSPPLRKSSRRPPPPSPSSCRSPGQAWWRGPRVAAAWKVACSRSSAPGGSRVQAGQPVGGSKAQCTGLLQACGVGAAVRRRAAAALLRCSSTRLTRHSAPAVQHAAGGAAAGVEVRLSRIQVQLGELAGGAGPGASLLPPWVRQRISRLWRQPRHVAATCLLCGCCSILDVADAATRRLRYKAVRGRKGKLQGLSKPTACACA